MWPAYSLLPMVQSKKIKIHRNLHREFFAFSYEPSRAYEHAGSQQVNSFLGTINHFRDSTRDQLSIVHPLHQLILDCNLSVKII